MSTELRKKQLREASRRYEEKHRAERVERNRLDRENNPERWREYERRYRQRHPERLLAKNQTRRARKHGADPAQVDLNDIAERDNHRCHICKRKVSTQARSLDHLVALSAGGAHTPENVALAHRRCNSKMRVHRLPAQLRLIG